MEHRCNLVLPDPVAHALERLERAGYEAYAVGGCVRDSLLGRAPNDWDITTSARPEETARVFSDCRTVEIGVRHGTLTVILEGMPLEITTFRSDGVYEDNRHPVQVRFSMSVEEDLSRRDFTVNAMAYHPKRGLVDVFGGLEDLHARRIRCVGDAKTRFCEDGLRILRAIRFASVLDFSVEEQTASAVHECRGLLSNIAPERIRVELCKLVCGKGAVAILREYVDVLGEFLPELLPMVGKDQNTKYHCFDVYEHTLQALAFADESADLITRLAILFHDIGKPLCYTEDELGGHFKGHAGKGKEIVEDICHRLRFDNATRDSLVLLVERHDPPLSSEPKAVKRLMRQMKDEDIFRLLEIKRCDRLAHAKGYDVPPPELEQIPQVMKQIREADACLSLKSLAVKGDDLMKIGIPKGREIGEMLAGLLELVLDEELPNEKNALICAAKEIWSTKR
ncbi:MAG: HD domain-containing protein [Clostridia bacterium]|nr:HD domain-containing protein [Clostridia bacterium]